MLSKDYLSKNYQGGYWKYIYYWNCYWRKNL